MSVPDTPRFNTHKMHKMHDTHGMHEMRGSALVVGLIMLVLMTMLALASFRLGSVQTIVVSNATQQNQGVAAAQQAIETVINTANFTTNPDAAITSSSCGTGVANELCVSSNGTAIKDFKVTLPKKPFCVTAAPIPTSQLDLSAGPAAPDLGCLNSVQQGQFGVAGGAGASSMCANSVWEVTAQAASMTDDTNAVTVTEGVSQRILTANMTNYCP